MSNKNYAMGHAISLHDIFMNYPEEKLKMTSDQCKETYSDGNKRDLAASIFAKSVQMVVDDIIDNNDIVPIGYPTVPEINYGFGVAF